VFSSRNEVSELGIHLKGQQDKNADLEERITRLIEEKDYLN